MEDVVHQNSLILSTAGAVPVVNDKGEVYMKKVKVQRYISGRRPKYAPEDSEESASSEDDFIVERQRPSRRIERTEIRTEADQSGSEDVDEEEVDEEQLQDEERSERTAAQEVDDEDVDDPRLRRLMRRKQEARAIQSATVVEGDDSDREYGRRRHRSSSSSSSSSDNEDLDDEERERKRLQIKQRALQRARDQEEELVRETENKQDEEPQEEESEYEEYTESEEEEQGPRLKPVFVRQRDRITIQEREQEEERKYRAELEQKKAAEERRRQTLKLVESEVRKEVEENREETKTGACVGNIEDVNTDDENDEAAYEAWKVRELKRIKRDRELRDAIEKERLEVERLRNMTEEERLRELKNNPKKIINKSTKGKYKYLQKYYHRGSYFVQEQEDDIYRRDFSVPTLDDHFNKSVLPKVMQVKNFGRSGRTKYTHLLDQDTTKADSPWSADTAPNLKWHIEKAGGSKAIFDRPSKRKQRN